MQVGFAEVLGCAIGAFCIIGMSITAGHFVWGDEVARRPPRGNRNGGMRSLSRGR